MELSPKANAPKTKMSGDPLPLSGYKYYLIILAEEIVQAITDINVSTKFKGNWATVAAALERRHNITSKKS